MNLIDVLEQWDSLHARASGLSVGGACEFSMNG
eukprot:CAMPEP_0177326936 /NCGR_PEP_ID=MMETSP0368-20130122/18617_1 /TAXON_ID=447022 ORGANISM="Scrippsiella hangoei-like, Strain SHHI-4" /NCGR_SAMPLE_ID=MMETSP0368 /ASSEMBLY_ACC=CAM_ASM_000363 /LENGTH=32 /DNA_ID= /DNA_START= /DNA_END= /DNA_ORIENTATION=